MALSILTCRRGQALGCAQPLLQLVGDDVFDGLRWEQPLSPEGGLGGVRPHEHHCRQTLDLHQQVSCVSVGNT